MQNLCAIIPARYKSRRIPGKPLIKILNKELLLLTYEKVKKVFEEKDITFSVGISLTSDEKYYVISTSDSHTVEEYFFLANEKKIKLQLFKKREKGIRYSIDSWKGDWYIQTNKNAPDYQILKCKHNNIENTDIFIPPEKETIIGGLDFLDNYILRAVSSNAIPKIFVRNIKTNHEEEIIFSDEPVGSPGFSLIQKNTNTSKIRISWDSLASPGKIFEYDILTKKKKTIKRNRNSIWA